MHKISKLLDSIDKSKLESEIAEFESKTHTSFREVADQLLLKQYQKNLSTKQLIDTIEKTLGDLNDTINISDESIKELAQQEIIDLTKKLDELYVELEDKVFEALPNDDKKAIFEIRPGVGGVEASIFAEEIFIMYQKYCSKNNYKINIISIEYNQEGGINGATFIVDSVNSFSTFRFEAGVHRVQRVPKTEALGRVHTSTVSVVVMPEIEFSSLNISPSDLKIDVYRASGPGGQSVNTTDSAVRVTHIPTKITVTCQNGKSQHKNKETALQILASRLQEIEEEKVNSEINEIRNSSIMGGKRSSKIRTYNFPQGRITDHRINKSWFNITQAVSEGAIDDIINNSNKLIRRGETTNTESDED